MVVTGARNEIKTHMNITSGVAWGFGPTEYFLTNPQIMFIRLLVFAHGEKGSKKSSGTQIFPLYEFGGTLYPS